MLYKNMQTPIRLLQKFLWMVNDLEATCSLMTDVKDVCMSHWA
jgi:hypothetical protein